MTRCSNCGAQVEPGEKFCVACGTPVVNATKECPYCYSDVDIRASVCPVCRRDIDELDLDSGSTSPVKEKKGCLIQWKYTPVVIILLLVACGMMYIINSGEDNGDKEAPARALPPTYTPRGRSFEETLKDEINSELADYDYEKQKAQIRSVDISGNELVAYIEQQGPPSLRDGAEQLDIIHRVIAKTEPNVDRVRTFYYPGENGFVVKMDDLINYSQGRLSYDDFRVRWMFFEP